VKSLKKIPIYLLLTASLVLGFTWASEGIESNGMDERLETKMVLLTYQLERQIDPKLAPGVVKLVQEGSNGWKERIVKTTYFNGQIVRSEVIEEKVLEKPVNKIVVVGEKKKAMVNTPPERKLIKTSRGTFRYRKALSMKASAYAPDRRWGRRTASGLTAKHGIVAVDRGFIPLGTRLYIEGYGHALAADVGSAIKGNRIDLFFESYQKAIRFGRRTMKVYILD